MSLIICLSGKKQSGKNTSANFICGKFLKKHGMLNAFKINEKGLLEARVNGHWFTVEEGEFEKCFSSSRIKLYSFADPLKQFCIDVFGLTYEQCYGTDEQKNSYTNLCWQNMPTTEIGEHGYVSKTGSMTAREVLQYFGTEIVRKMFYNAWVNATISKIKRDNPQLAIITDGRFVNEIEKINEIGGKTIRLTRSVCEDGHESEKALDNFPLEKFSFVISNQNSSIDEQCSQLEPTLNKWLDKI